MKSTLSDTEAINNVLEKAFSWFKLGDAEFSLDRFFDLLINVDTYVATIYGRLLAFGIDIGNEMDIETFLAEEDNRKTVLNLKQVDEFVFSLVTQPSFIEKLNALTADFDISILSEAGLMPMGWSLNNWVEENVSKWGTDLWSTPSISKINEFFGLVYGVLMPENGFNRLGWGSAYVMNFIDCFR